MLLNKKLKILVTNQKGGVGKSSLSANLAAYFAIEKEQQTVLVDFDRQATSSQWVVHAKPHPKLRAESVSQVIHGGNRLSLFGARSTIRDAASKADVVITDITWSPVIGPDILDVFDLVLVPTSLSELELLSTIGLLRDLRMGLTKAGAPKLVLCPNKVHPFQRKFNAMAAQRFPVPFLLAPPITQSKEFEVHYQKDFIIRAGEAEVQAKFRQFGQAIEQAAAFVPTALSANAKPAGAPATEAMRVLHERTQNAPANSPVVQPAVEEIPSIIRAKPATF
jgi:cellulose biosynthesis protein BcsQ